MILSKKSIFEEIEKGNILISPFHESQLTPNGYDLHLGKMLAVFTGGHKIDPKEDIRDRFQFIEIPPEGYVLEPFQFVLGVTAEYTETRNHVPVMEGKSTNARMGLEPHFCAGFGDVGFKGNWTLELRATRPIVLYAGMPIGQLVYHTITEQTDGDGYDVKGSYNNAPEETPRPVLPNLHLKMHQFIEV
jgi:dCTP deaminase